jgi:hypothetical protein
MVCDDASGRSFSVAWHSALYAPFSVKSVIKLSVGSERDRLTPRYLTVMHVQLIGRIFRFSVYEVAVYVLIRI